MNAVFATGRNEVQRTLRQRMAITYNDLFLDIRRELKQGGVIDTTLEARELTCFGVNKTREELTRDGRLYAPPELERRVRELTARHLAGEPVAYLIGEWEFYGLPLDISKEVRMAHSIMLSSGSLVVKFCIHRPGAVRNWASLLSCTWRPTQRLNS